MVSNTRVSALVSEMDRRCEAELPRTILALAGGCEVWAKAPNGVRDAFVRSAVPRTTPSQVAPLRDAVTRACLPGQLAPLSAKFASAFRGISGVSNVDRFVEFLRARGVGCEAWALLTQSSRESHAAGYLGVGPEIVQQAALVPFDQWVSTPATQGDVDLVTADFNLSLSQNYRANMSLVNALRFLRWFPLAVNEFPWPLPVKNDGYNSYSIYEYFKSLNLEWRIITREINPWVNMGAADGNVMLFNETYLSNRSALEVFDVASLIVHEVRHSPRGGGLLHTCNSSVTLEIMAASNGEYNPDGIMLCDPNYSSRGAWAMEYLFYKAARDYVRGMMPPSWNGLLTSRMNDLSRIKICDPSDAP